MASTSKAEGYTPQRPVKRALKQNPKAVRAWLQDIYLRLAERARTEGAIYWGDETAVKYAA
ncbi:winged helix-turn-helix domain-containing protein [Azotobacter armeniacus]